MQAGGVLSLLDSLPCAISRRRGISSFQGRGHSPSPAVRAPSAGDVASPPVGGGVIAQVQQSVRHQQATWHPLLSGEGS